MDGHSSYITTSGLNLQIQSAAIANGVATVTFRITDGTGVPLDRTGLYTEGAVSMNWLIARLNLDADGSPGQYTNYITKVETNPADPTQTATQASSENNGTWTEIGSGAGTYQYTFKTAVNPPDPTLTHTIGVYASRVFQNETYVANATYDFRPDSEPVTVQRQEVTEATCNQCHNPLEMHGGVRRETALCILCHTPQSGDAETGNTVDFKVLIHKIHQGANLPSVKNGIPYEIVGYQQSVNNFSNIVWPQDTGHCQTCHQNDAPAGATSGSPTNSFEPDVWKTKPSSAACFSCHDNLVATPIAGSTKLNITVKWPTDFGFPSAGPCATDADCRTGFNVTATCNTTPGAMLGHCQLTQHPTGNVGDADCATCHAVGAAIAPIDLAHQDLKYDPNQDALRINIVAVNDTAPGDIPVMTFQVTDQKTGKPYDIIANPMVRLSTNVAGPTTDYAQEWSTRVQGSGASGTLAPDPSGMPGLFQYTFPSANAIPASATGTYAFGLEGYTMATDNATRLSIPNPVFYAAVTDATPMARQPVVDTNKCDSCHKTIGSNHGYMRNNTDYCVMCHNANLDDKDRLPMLQGQTLTVWSMHFTRLIHEIHRGSSLSTPFMVGGSRPTASNPAGSPADFSQVVFPGDLKDCETCHLPGTYNLPVPAGRLPSLSETFTCEDPNPQPGLLCPANNWNSTATYTPPETAVCTACHDTPDTAAHAEAMTSGLGESCSVCHAIGRDFGVDVVHASPP